MSGKPSPNGTDPSFIVILQRERQERGWTQSFVAYKSGVSQQLVNCWENGRRYPNLRNLIAWARALGYELVLRKL